MSLHETYWGDGPAVLLVHGSVTSGEMTWSEQKPLGRWWRLRVIDRRGFFPNPPADGEDFEADAVDVAELLTEPAHLVGESYGGVVALLAAAARPEMVRSLTVNEPPAFGIVRDEPAVARWIKQTLELWTHGPQDPTEFLRAFSAVVGADLQFPDPLPPPLVQNAHMLRNARPPWEAEIPLGTLRDAPFPKLVVSGGHSPAFDTVCDALQVRLSAQREVIVGAGHSVHRTGQPYNAVLHTFLSSVS